MMADDCLNMSSIKNKKHLKMNLKLILDFYTSLRFSKLIYSIVSIIRLLVIIFYLESVWIKLPYLNKILYY